MGNNRDKLRFWQKVSYYFNFVAIFSIAIVFGFKKIFLPYRTIMSVYLVVVLLVGVVAAVMTAIIKHKLNSGLKN